MARGRKKALNLDEQLAKVVSEIAETEDHLKELKDTKKELEEQVKMSRVAALDELIASSGLSLDEVKKLLENR